MNTFRTLSEIQSAISAGSLTCVQLVDQYLSRIEAASSLNAFIEVFDIEARQHAVRIDEKIRQGTSGKLAGLVLGIKDVICYQNHGLTASSRILEGFSSLFTATALERLLAEDVIIIGRQSCDEFAMGSSNENSCYGPVRNPHDESRVPGGSSGASATAVSAGLCHAALGSDTGGSVRQPAAFCGVIGMKPTYGRVSRYGLIAYASSFDQIGPITRSVEDSARILAVMAGHDSNDNTSSISPVDDFHEGLTQKETYTIGYLAEALESPGLSPEIRKATLETMEKLESQGHTLKEVTFPYLDHVVPCYYVLTTAEASSNLSRYDGIRYGFRAPEAKTLEEVYVESRTQGFGAEVKKRILLGTFVLSAGYYDAYYTKAMKVRRLIRDHTYSLLESCDFLLTPTTPTTAFTIGEKSNDPISMFLSDIFTVHANLAGTPAISLPIGKDQNGLPIGIQLMGRPFEESKLFSLAESMESGI